MNELQNMQEDQVMPDIFSKQLRMQRKPQQTGNWGDAAVSLVSGTFYETASTSLADTAAVEKISDIHNNPSSMRCLSQHDL